MTKHYKLIDWYRDGCISGPPNCVHMNLDRSQAWDLFDKLVEHLRFNENNDQVFELTFPCELEPCGRMGEELVPNTKECPKCNGEGWLWWDELDSYHGPGRQTGQDDTKYICDKCDGTGQIIEKEENDGTA